MTDDATIVGLLIAILIGFGFGALLRRPGGPKQPTTDGVGRRPEPEPDPPRRTANEVRNDHRDAHRDAVDAAARDHGRNPDDVEDILEWADKHRTRHR